MTPDRSSDDALGDIHDLEPGDVVSLSVPTQSSERQFIVDDREPKRDDSVPLLGKEGGVYHLEQTGDVVHLNIYSRPRGDWIGQATCAITDLGLDREPFAVGTPLTKLFPGSERARICSVLVDERRRALPVDEVARQAGLPVDAVRDHLDALTTLDVARRRERATDDGVEQDAESDEQDGDDVEAYQLADSDVARRLYELDGLTLKTLLDARDASETASESSSGAQDQ